MTYPQKNNPWLQSLKFAKQFQILAKKKKKPKNSKVKTFKKQKEFKELEDLVPINY